MIMGSSMEQEPDSRAIAAYDAILDELERRRQLRQQNRGILSSVCQKPEDRDERDDRVRTGQH